MCLPDLGYLRFLPNHLSWQGRIWSPVRLNGMRLLQSYLIWKILYCLHCVLDEVGYPQPWLLREANLPSIAYTLAKNQQIPKMANFFSGGSCLESITNDYKTQNQQGEYAGTEPFFSMYFDDIAIPKRQNSSDKLGRTGPITEIETGFGSNRPGDVALN